MIKYYKYNFHLVYKVALAGFSLEKCYFNCDIIIVDPSQ
jgi:hypothetical protein